MSTWTAPITFTAASVLTAAQMNAEVRDHALFLKGSLDLITGSTTADTGTATYLSIIRPTAGDHVLRGAVTGDTQQRIIVGADGRILLGNGASVADVTVQRIGVGIWGALETRLRATGASAATLTYDTLVTGDAVQRWTMGADGTMSWGPGTGAVDTVLSRTAANILSLAAGDSYAVAGTQVVTTRQTGWTVATGTPSRATFTTSGVTLATLAGVVMALEQDLITHGLIGA